VTPRLPEHCGALYAEMNVTLLVPVRSSWLFLCVRRLFFGLEPVIDFGVRLIAALNIKFVSATADAFFKRKLLDRGFLRAS
jgi:hypothetical protein